MVAILCCFGYVIYNANEKLQSGIIGTAFNTVHEEMVQGGVIWIVNQKVAFHQTCSIFTIKLSLQYPPITVCIYRDYRDFNGEFFDDTIDEIRNLTEFPKDTRTDMITHLSYSSFSNGFDSKMIFLG